MSDEIDRANEHADAILSAALTVRKPEGPRATGCCLNCDEPVADGRRWCDFDCLSQWERRQR